MSALVRYTAFEPLVTGPLLWVLTRGSPDLRDRVLRPLASLPFKVEPTKLVSALKWLFALGLAGYFNRFMNRLALEKWSFTDRGAPWNYPREIAVVTGGSGGIGSEVIKKLAPTGMRIAILDVQEPPPSLTKFSNVSFYKCDITSPEAVNEAANAIRSDIGIPSILFNNAGIGKTFTILDVPTDYLEKIFHINLISHWYTIKAFLPGMISNKKGHIVSTASMASYTAVAGMVDYCVSKAGVMSLHEGLNQELKHRYNAPFIRTTAVHPYWVQTPMFDASWTAARKIGNPVMTPEYAGGRIADAILSGKSGHMTLPHTSGILQAVTGARGWPHWMHELANDTTQGVTA